MKTENAEVYYTFEAAMREIAAGACEDHPRYKAKRQPMGLCRGCWTLWTLRTIIEIFDKVDA